MCTLYETSSLERRFCYYVYQARNAFAYARNVYFLRRSSREIVVASCKTSQFDAFAMDYDGEEMYVNLEGIEYSRIDRIR